MLGQAHAVMKNLAKTATCFKTALEADPNSRIAPRIKKALEQIGAARKQN